MRPANIPGASTVEQWELRFMKGVSMLLAACRQPADDVTLETYALALALRWEIEEWDAFVVHALRTDRYEGGRFPATAELADDVNAWRTDLARTSMRPAAGALPPPPTDKAAFSSKIREILGDDAAPMRYWPTEQSREERDAELARQRELILKEEPTQ